MEKLNYSQKRTLYENIMRTISKEVKSMINEAYVGNSGNDFDTRLDLRNKENGVKVNISSEDGESYSFIVKFDRDNYYKNLYIASVIEVAALGILVHKDIEVSIANNSDERASKQFRRLISNKFEEIDKKFDKDVDKAEKFFNDADYSNIKAFGKELISYINHANIMPPKFNDEMINAALNGRNTKQLDSLFDEIKSVMIELNKEDQEKLKKDLYTVMKKYYRNPLMK